jgi:hypothetical protein
MDTVKAGVTRVEEKIDAALSGLQGAPVPGNQRSDTDHFLGREVELRQLTAAVFAGHLSVVTAVHGLGGMGKTELAVTFAQRPSDRFQGGMWELPAESRCELLPLIGGPAAPLGLSARPDETAATAAEDEAAALALARELGGFTLALDSAEEVLRAEPKSTWAIREVSVNLNKLADLLVRGGQPGDLEQALVQYALAISYDRTGAVADAAGDADRAMACLRGCYEVLHELIAAGVELDQAMVNLHERLKPRFRSEP